MTEPSWAKTEFVLIGLTQGGALFVSIVAAIIIAGAIGIGYAIAWREKGYTRKRIAKFSKLIAIETRYIWACIQCRVKRGRTE